MEQKHTELPWKFDSEYLELVTLNDDIRIGELDCNSDTDAQFIVTACNSHYELLELLQLWAKWFEKTAPKGTENFLFEETKSAIQKATQNEKNL